MSNNKIKLGKDDELLLAFEKTEVGAVTRSHTNVGKVPRTRVNKLEGVDSWTILAELVKRHIIDLQVVGFWCLLFGIILYKAGII